MDLDDIVKKLGWDDGFQIPIASVENKALEEQLAKLSLKKNKTKNELDRAKSRLEGLKEHFKYVNQENEQNQKLITAHRQQFETMEHCYHLAKSEKTNVENDVKKITKDLVEVEQRQETKKTELQKYMAKAEKLKTETEWDAEALKAWEETLKKRDDDIEIVKKFSMEDARKYNDLEARRQLMQVESDKRKKFLGKMLDDYRNNEMIIDRTGKVLKQLETERDALVGQWKETVKMLQQRDEDVVRAQEQIVTTQELTEKQKDKLEEENGFLANERRNNHELDLEMESLNVLNSRMRRDYGDLTQGLLMLNSELQALKRTVASTAQQLENERIRHKMIIHNIVHKEQMCGKFDEDIVKLKQKLEEMKGSTMNSTEKIKNIERMLELAERSYNIYITDTEKINGQLFRNDKAYKELLSVGRTLVMDLDNTTLFCAQLRKHIRNERKELEKIKEVVYNMEYRIDEFEERLLKLECDSEGGDSPTEENEKDILQVEQILTDHRALQHALQIQVDKLREEMARLNTAIELDKEQLAILREKCEQHLIENEISRKHIAVAKKSTQEKQVEENMMRLRINQIEKDMKKEEKMIFTMEKLRLNLDQAMRERQIEVNTKKMILQAKRRNLDEDKGRLRGDIALCRVKMGQLQKKYHILLTSLGKDDEGQTISVAAFKIKYAQEKFLLQQEGDALDQKIKTAEKEIVAMENTLKIVNLSNAAFKNSLAPVKDDDKEVEEMKFLEEEVMKKNTTFREYKRELAKKREELEAFQEEIKEKSSIREKIQENVTNLEDEFEMVQKQELDKAEKLKRTECQVKKLLKKLGKTDISQYNRDFEIRLLKEGNKGILQKLTEMCGLCPEMAPLINRYTIEHNLNLPEKRTSWSSSSSSLHRTTDSCSSSHQQYVTPTTPSALTPNTTGSELSLNKVDLTFRF